MRRVPCVEGVKETPMSASVLFIVPAFNEELNIVRVIDNLIKHYSQYDYVIINDGSSDKTANVCKANNYNMIDLPINLGLEGAFQCGMRYAFYKGYEYAVQFDGDGQHNPEYVSAMLSLSMHDGYDVVIGSRFVTEKKPWSARMIGSRVIGACIFLTTGKRIHDPTSGMRLYNKKIIEILAKSLHYGPEPNTIAHLIRCNANVGECQVCMDDRLAGTSYLSITNSIKYMLRMVISILFVQWFRKKV